MKRISELTFEIEETVVLKQAGCIRTDYCPDCRRLVEMLSPAVLSHVTGISEREIFQFVEANGIYFVEAERIVVCPGCLQKKTTTAQTKVR